MSVLVAAPLRDGDPWWGRWINCYGALTFQGKGCCIASESPECRIYVKTHWPHVRVLDAYPWRPAFTRERIFNISACREAIRREVCEDPGVTWLLFIDIDLNYPPDTVERVLDLARQGYDLVFSRRPGLLSLIHRDICLSCSFMTGVNYRSQGSTLEEHFQVERQIEVYNSVRPQNPFFRVYGFEAKWLQHRDSPPGTYP